MKGAARSARQINARHFSAWRHKRDLNAGQTDEGPLLPITDNFSKLRRVRCGDHNEIVRKAIPNEGLAERFLQNAVLGIAGLLDKRASLAFGNSAAVAEL